MRQTVAADAAANSRAQNAAKYPRNRAHHRDPETCNQTADKRRNTWHEQHSSRDHNRRKHNDANTPLHDAAPLCAGTPPRGAPFVSTATSASTIGSVHAPGAAM